MLTKLSHLATYLVLPAESVCREWGGGEGLKMLSVGIFLEYRPILIPKITGLKMEFNSWLIIETRNVVSLPLCSRPGRHASLALPSHKYSTKNLNVKHYVSANP